MGNIIGVVLWGIVNGESYVSFRKMIRTIQGMVKVCIIKIIDKIEINNYYK